MTLFLYIFQNEEICMAAVKEDGWALLYVEHQNAEICMAAVKQAGFALQYVKEQTLDICMTAVKQHGLALQYVKQQTKDICVNAIKNHEDALQYVQEQTEDLCLDAVNRDIMTLKYIKDKTILNSICNSLNIIYLPSNANHKDLIIRFIDGKYRCWIGCQKDISVDTLILQIYNTNGGLPENPHRQHYIDFLKKHNLYNIA